MSQPHLLHRWDLTPQEAIQVQKELADKVIREGQPGDVKVVVGIDISANDRTGMARAAIVALAYPSMEVLERIRHEESLRFPYIPGLLSFREVPSILGGFQQLRHRPDLLMVDGQGIAHPRRIGIASHLGVLLDLPSIGCAKSILTGRLSSKVGEEVGARVPLMAGPELLGMGVRTKVRTNPMIISIWRQQWTTCFPAAGAIGYRSQLVRRTTPPASAAKGTTLSKRIQIQKKPRRRRCGSETARKRFAAPDYFSEVVEW
jgi:deoxyribonuclease V